MSIGGLPIPASASGAVGAAAGDPIAVSGIKTSDVVLSIIRWKPGETAAGVDPATFVVADNAIESASVATDGYHVHVIWTRP